MQKIFKRWNFELVFQLFVPLLIGYLVSYFVQMRGSFSTENTYLTLPPILFIIVWTALYLMMGYSAYRIEFESGEKKLKLYYLSLLFNFAWTPLYFGLNSPVLALIDLIILLSLVIYMFFKFYRIDKLGGLLLIPYIMWLIFAFSLNISAIF